MNPFVFTVFALCVSSSAMASQSYGSNNQYASGYGSQRKMSPAPQQYGAQAAGYGLSAEQSYGAEMASYANEHNQPTQTYQAPAPAYKAPSLAQVSSYDERAPAASGYGKQQQSYAAAPAPAASYGGHAKQAAKYEEYHAPMPFAWGYDINDGYGGAQYHKETGDEYGKRTGSYGYTDAYGVYRQVDYVADEHGFRATIKTNEPGTANESPADVELHAYEPPSNYYAGNTNYANQAGYGAQSGRGKASKGYAAPASSYGQQASGYGGQQRASYGKQQSSYAAPARQSYQEQQSYSSSAINPVYSNAVTAPAVTATKKY